jgi:hypothetical protein
MQELASPDKFVTPGAGTPAPPKHAPPPPQQSSRVLTIVLFVVAVALGSVATVAVVKRGQPAVVVQPTPTPVEPVKPPPPQPPPAPSAVTFHIDSEPQGASVTEGDKVLGVTPLDFDRPAGADGRTRAEVTLTLEGYVPITVTAGGSGPRIEVLQKLQVEKAPVIVQPPAPAPAPAPVKPAPPPSKPQPPAKKKPATPVKGAKLDDEEEAPPVPTHAPPKKGDTLKKPK